MFEPFVVEVWGRPVGILLEEGGAFRFHAIARGYSALQGTPFAAPGQARLAAVRLHADALSAEPPSGEVTCN